MKQVAIRVHYYNHKVVYVGNIKDWSEYLNENFKDETEILRSASLYFRQIVTIAKPNQAIGETKWKKHSSKR